MVVRAAALCVRLLVAASCCRGWCREFAPAGDLLSCAHKKVGKESAPVPSPLRCATGCPALLGGRGRAQLASFTAFTTLRQRGAKSDDEARCARAPAPCDARLLQRGVQEQPKQPNSRNSQQPSPNAVRSWLFLHPPFEPAEQRKDLRACAKRTSWTDFAQLSERSVAERVLREPSRPEQRRAARSEAKGRADRGRLFAYFLVAQKVGRPPGRIPGTVDRVLALQPSAPITPALNATSHHDEVAG